MTEKHGDPQWHRRLRCPLAEATALTVTHSFSPFLPLQDFLCALLPPMSSGLREGSNEKQIHGRHLDLSKHHKDPGRQACSIKGWKGQWNGHLREFIVRSSRQGGHQLLGLAPSKGDSCCMCRTQAEARAATGPRCRGGAWRPWRRAAGPQ